MKWDLLLSFSFGLIVGSFVNVLIHRMPRMIMHHYTNQNDHQSCYNLCWPTSHCPQCQIPLKLWHNIPLLSYICLKGRCSFCQKNISLHYPIIELLTASIWLTCYWHWGFTASGLCWAGFTTVLLTLSVIDWQTTLLPDDLTQPLVWGGLISSALGWLPLPLDQSVWGAAIGYTSLWSIAALFKHITGKLGMGAGDFKLLAGLGAWLGPLALLVVILLASISGTLFGLLLKFCNQLYDDGYIPFGPFLAFSGGVVAFVGVDSIAYWLGW